MKFFLRVALQTVLWVLIALLSLLVVSGILQQWVLKGKYTGLFGVGYAVVVSGSMVPALEIDDMIFYHAHPEQDYRPGDVIVYRADREEGEILITHRIVRFSEGKVITLGDANRGHEDEPFPPEKIVGKVVLRLRGAGKVLDFIRTVPGILAIALVLSGLTFLNLALSSRRFRRKRTATVSGEQKIRY